MRTWDTEPTRKEISRNLESTKSKLVEINKILEPTEWDKVLVKTVKKNLSQLLIDKKYNLFQEEIGMPPQLRDGFLWQKTFDYLLTYIIWVEDKAEDSIWETMRHIWEIFKFWKSKHHTWNDNIIMETPQTSTTKKVTDESSKVNSKNSTNTTTTPMFWSIPLSKIKSYPVVKSEESGYCCSKTARLNGLHFWIYLPRWNAYSAWILPTTWSIGTIPKEKARQRPDKTWDAIWEEKFNSVSDKANFADIYAWSTTTYGHRAIAIRDSQWRWYLLDPYIKIDGETTLMPIKLGDYVKKWRKIVKAHFYHSDWYLN